MHRKVLKKCEVRKRKIMHETNKQKLENKRNLKSDKKIQTNSRN